MYDHGQGVEKDKKKAFEWFKKAAQQNHAIAQRILGVMYDHGQGVEQDKKKAFEWFEKAAIQNDAIAQRILGERYANSEGVEKDEHKASECFQKLFKNPTSNVQNVLNKSRLLTTLKEYKKERLNDKRGERFGPSFFNRFKGYSRTDKIGCVDAVIQSIEETPSVSRSDKELDHIIKVLTQGRLGKRLFNDISYKKALKDHLYTQLKPPCVSPENQSLSA